MRRKDGMIKSLTATGWGKQKETLLATCKTVMRQTLEYAYSTWSPLSFSTSMNKLQVMQNTALRTATGCTQDTNIHHLHDETLILSIREHLQLHASQYNQKTQHPSHPLHKHTTYFNTPRLKNTIFNNGRYTTTIPTDPHTITTTDIKTNMRHIHTSVVSMHLVTRGNNKILRTPPPHISSRTRRTLAQLRTNKLPFLKSYLHKVDAKSHPSPLFLLCNTLTHDTHHLFNCSHRRTTFSPLDFWTDAAGVTALLDGGAGWWTTSGKIGLPHLQGSWEWIDNNNRRWEEVITTTNMTHNSRKAWDDHQKTAPTYSLDCHLWICGQTPPGWPHYWPDGRRSWLVDQKREDRTPPISKGLGSG